MEPHNEQNEPLQIQEDYKKEEIEESEAEKEIEEDLNKSRMFEEEIKEIEEAQEWNTFTGNKEPSQHQKLPGVDKQEVFSLMQGR